MVLDDFLHFHIFFFIFCPTKRPVDGASPFPGNAHQGAGDSKNPQAEMPCPMGKKHDRGN